MNTVEKRGNGWVEGMNLGHAGLERSLANPSGVSHSPMSNLSVLDSSFRSLFPARTSPALAPRLI